MKFKKKMSIWNGVCDYEDASLFNEERWGALSKCDHYDNDMIFFDTTVKDVTDSCICKDCFRETRTAIFVTVLLCLKRFLLKDLIKLICINIEFPLELIKRVDFYKMARLALHRKRREFTKAVRIDYHNETCNFEELHDILNELFPNLAYIEFRNTSVDINEEGEQYMTNKSFESFCSFVELYGPRYIETDMFFRKSQIYSLIDVMPPKSHYRCKSFYMRDNICETGNREIAFCCKALRNHADNIFVRQEDDSSFDEEEYVDFLKKLYNTDEL